MLETICACGKTFQVPDEMAGRRARCKACGNIVTMGAQTPPVARPVTGSKIVVSCGCGRRFAASPHLVGTRIACPGCQAAMIVPYENSAVGSQDAAATAPTGSGYGLAEEASPEYSVNETTVERPAPRKSSGKSLVVGNEYEASNPGGVVVNFPKYWLAYPLWPSVWVAGAAVFLVMTFTVHYAWMAGVFAFGAATVYYWVLIFEHFRHGCVLPGIVLSEDKQLVAVYSDLSMRHGQSYPYIRVLRQPLHLARVPVHSGARVATVALYRGQPEESGRWQNFYPKVVACVVFSRNTAERVLESIDMEDWEMLMHGIEQLRTPYKPGLYKISKY